MSANPTSKWDGLKILQASYKKIGDHEIRVDMLVPENIPSGKRPVLVRFHGGGLMMGDSLMEPFWSQWVSDLALKYGAIIVSPNYRLLPEATTPEIFDDVEDFWKWLHSSAPHELLASYKSSTELDISRILVTGESAGGLLGTSLALAYPNEICAATVSYPWLAPDSIDFLTPRDKPTVAGHLSKSIIDDFMSSVAYGTSISSSEDQARLAACFSAIQHGTLGEIYRRGTEPEEVQDQRENKRGMWFPFERLEEPDVAIPRGGISILHGREDTVVPLHNSEDFIARAREVTKGQPGNEGLILTTRDGDHGFEEKTRLDEKWLQDAIRRAVNVWLE